MIDLSTMVGRVISPTNRRVATLRDRVIRAASVVPTLKRYILEMRFKPMPRYDQGAIAHVEPRIGDLADGHAVHPAPRRHPRRAERPARRRDRARVRRAELEQQPAHCCSATTPSRGGRRWAPASSPPGRSTQLHWTGHDDPEVVIVGDRTGALKSLFDGHAESVLFLRPDRCIAGACIAQLAPELSAALFDVLCHDEGRQ